MTGFLTAKFRRGYSRSRWPELFREDARCNMTTESSKRVTCIRDVFERYLKGMVIGGIEVFYPEHLHAYITMIERACYAAAQLPAPQFLLDEWERMYDELWDEDVNDVNGIVSEDVQMSISTPPRHGKTFWANVGFLFLHLLKPGYSSKYCGYSREFSLEAKNVFVRLLDYSNVEYVKSGKTVTLLAAKGENSIITYGGYKTGLAGTPCTGIAVLDDLLKSDEAANSLTQRDAIYAEIITGLFTRKQRHMNVILVNTRWHIDDITGRMVEKQGFKSINIKAICEDVEYDAKLGIKRELGSALCEQLKTLKDHLIYKANNPTEFATMFQGDPSRGSEKLFDNLLEHDTAYVQGHSTKTAYGLDLAYAEKENKKADWNVCVRLVRDYTDDIDRVDAVLRMRCNFADFLPHVVKFMSKKPGKIRWHPSGMERGATKPEVLRIIPNLDVSLVASKSKLLRASNTIERCKKGKLSTPRVKDDNMIAFEKCLDSFTGIGDVHDDDIDALASAESLLPKFGEPVGAVPDRRHEEVRRYMSNRWKV